MRKIALLLVFLLFTVFVFGYQFRIIDAPKEVTNHVGFVNLPDGDRYDINGELCGMLIVRTGIEEMNIDSPLRHRLIPKEGEYWVVLQRGAWYVDLKKVDYATLMVNLRESVGKIEAGKVYEMTIDGDGGNEFITISIIAEPEDSEKWLDGKLLGSEESYSVKKGEHRLEVRKTGYKTNISTINVDEDNVLFKDIELEKQRPVMLTISSEPQGAELYLDGVKEGFTNIQPFRFPQEYELRLVLDKYETIEEKIIVEESGNNSWNYDLLKITSILTIDITPADAAIYLNNQKMNGSSKEISAGQYLIEVSCPGWYPESRTVTVEKGKDKRESFALKQKEGSLQLTVSPMEAESVLKRNGKEIKSWTGSQYLEALPVGDYELTTILSGFETETSEIKIKEKELSSLKVELVAGSSKPAVMISNGDMVFVEGGTFQMGSASGDEKPGHSVTVSDFYIGKYEVTQSEYKAVMGTNPAKFKQTGEDAPVEQVGWYDAVKYCNKRSDQEGLDRCYTGSGTNNIKCDFNANGYRLPTEAEWEYVAKGGNKSNGYKYSGSNDLKQVAWYSDNSGNKTHSVGEKQANELGIFDMSGNVYEWCWDWYGDYSSSSTSNPRGQNLGSRRVYRGGSWSSDASSCRTAFRGSSPGYSLFILGFRLACSSK
ncbi:MAG: formylglycine-generating enzyme family protein [Candidatus Stygibacter australis]|nr:formylglycine-generating enzyme family protein [Candidatus Stygibacter australis]